jgi:hypothetical protein
MQREYLEEDLRLIRTYFPGARTVALRTPFDLTPKAPAARLPEEAFRAEPGGGRWYGDLQWSR